MLQNKAEELRAPEKKTFLNNKFCLALQSYVKVSSKISEMPDTADEGRLINRAKTE